MKSNRHFVAILDDDPLVRQSIQRLVRSHGMYAETFASGREFIDRLAATPSLMPDCMIIDMQMPGLNGLQVREYLRSRRRDVPVIFVTALREAWIREQALASGAIAFFQKPFDGNLFIKTLRAVVEIEGGREP